METIRSKYGLPGAHLLLSAGFLRRAPAAIFAFGLAALWAQTPEPDSRILNRAAERHAANPAFRVTLRKAGPFQFGERIFVDSNVTELSKRLYPPTHEEDPFEVRRDREAALHFAYMGALLEGPVSCGDFAVPCRYASFQRTMLLGGARSRDDWSIVNAVLPPLTPGKYRLALLLRLQDERRVEAETLSRLKGEKLPEAAPEDEYLVSNVLAFEVLPLNAEWVNSRLAAVSSLRPPGGSKPLDHPRPVPRSRPMLLLNDPLAELLFLPTEATLSTAYEFYIENGFEPLLAAFYYHPDLKFSCRFLMEQISQPGYPLPPKILEHIPHVCVDSEHHYQQHRDAGTRGGSPAYYAALQLRFDDYNRFRLQLARRLAERLRGEPENETALQGLIETTGALYRPSLVAEQLKGELMALLPILEPRLRKYSLPVQRMLLERPDLLPESAVTAMAIKVLEERWPESICVDGKLLAGREPHSWIQLRQVAFGQILKSDPARARALVAEMIERTDPTLNSDLVKALPFPVPVPPALLARATAGNLVPTPCGVYRESQVIRQLQLQAMSLEELENLARSEPARGPASAPEVLLHRNPKRFAALIVELLRAGEERVVDFAHLLLWDQRAPYEVPPAVFDEMGLALLTRSDLESQVEGARVLRLGWKDHKKLLIEKYRKIDRSLLARDTDEAALERAEVVFRDAISRGRGWFTTREEILELHLYCDFEQCKNGLELDMQYLQPVVSMSIDVADASRAQTRIRFAQYSDQESVLYDNEDTLNLIRRYPRDTPIRIRRWTLRAPQRPLDIEMSWRSKLRAEGFRDVEIEIEP